MSDDDRFDVPGDGGPILILVKHAMPVLVPDFPARRWTLGDEGRRQSHALADQVRRFHPTVVVNSVEPKARQTAAIAAADLGRVTRDVAGLHEHERDNVGWLGDDELRRGVEQFFANPDAVVFGQESAAAALTRFSVAVDSVLGAHPGESVLVVAHGTVISLFVAARTGVDGFDLWRRLTCPSFVVLSCLDDRLLDIVDSVEADTE